MNQEIIDKINEKCSVAGISYEQGIFVQPNYVPHDIKEPVIYSWYETGGVRGGSCWDSSNPQRYIEDIPKNHMQVLDMVLEEVCPNISYLQYKKIQNLIHDNEETDREYYGNSTDYYVEYILISEFEKLIETF